MHVQAIKQLKYCWYLDIFIIFGLLIVKIYVPLLFRKKKWQGFDILTFLWLWNKRLPVIRAVLYKRRASQFQNLISAGSAY